MRLIWPYQNTGCLLMYNFLMNSNLNLGKSDELFYWGPSKALPIFMSDFMAASEQFFVELYLADSMPKPPKALVLFYQGKMVWLSNARDFANFTEQAFKKYSEENRFDKDYQAWEESKQRLAEADAPALVEVWKHTLYAEFSLYGAEVAISKMLEHLSPEDRQKVWGTFTHPDKPTFLNQIDMELYESKDIIYMSEKYPWIGDGYGGPTNSAKGYFTIRLAIVEENPPTTHKVPEREELAKEHDLSPKEVASLTLARNLAKFIDDRKAWMMATRRNIKTPASDITHGWIYDQGRVDAIDGQEVESLWQKYVDFKASSSVVQGLVASNGGRHSVNGEVRVLSSPTDNVESGMIIVVPSTSPSYVPLMRRAKALITDHGGMLSHAAIVGREFSLPCIVGTKQATKVLKDGDKVVLDLITGEVSR